MFEFKSNKATEEDHIPPSTFEIQFDDDPLAAHNLVLGSLVLRIGLL